VALFFHVCERMLARSAHWNSHVSTGRQLYRATGCRAAGPPAATRVRVFIAHDPEAWHPDPATRHFARHDWSAFLSDSCAQWWKVRSRKRNECETVALMPPAENRENSVWDDAKAREALVWWVPSKPRVLLSLRHVSSTSPAARSNCLIGSRWAKRACHRATEKKRSWRSRTKWRSGMLLATISRSLYRMWRRYHARATVFQAKPQHMENGRIMPTPSCQKELHYTVIWRHQHHRGPHVRATEPTFSGRPRRTSGRPTLPIAAMSSKQCRAALPAAHEAHRRTPPRHPESLFRHMLPMNPPTQNLCAQHTRTRDPRPWQLRTTSRRSRLSRARPWPWPAPPWS